MKIGIKTGGFYRENPEDLKAYNFARYRNGEKMASGIRVHGFRRRTATLSAIELNWRFDTGKYETLRFVDNEPCIGQCHVCNEKK